MLQLLDANGEKKYLSQEERAAFISCAARQERVVATYCLALAHSGCRISEALALTANRIGLETGRLVFETLKRRKRGVFRMVPVPPSLIDSLNMVHGIQELQERAAIAAAKTSYGHGSAPRAGAMCAASWKRPGSSGI
jgi:integrase/recombinase XerD